MPDHDDRTVTRQRQVSLLTNISMAGFCLMWAPRLIGMNLESLYKLNPKVLRILYFVVMSPAFNNFCNAIAVLGGFVWFGGVVSATILRSKIKGLKQESFRAFNEK